MRLVPDFSPLPIAVAGAGSAPSALAETAAEVGREIARRGGVLLCGGRTGVMEHSARGAREAGGTTIGILPGRPEQEAPNVHLQYRIFTGLGQARNQVLVLSAGAVIAVGGEWGTLSEIALALKHRIPVVSLASVPIVAPDGHEDALLFRAETAEQAVELAFANARRLS